MGENADPSKEMAEFGAAEDNLVPKDQYEDFERFRAAYSGYHKRIDEAMEQNEQGRATAES